VVPSPAPAADRGAPPPATPLLGTCAAAATLASQTDRALDALLDEAGRHLTAGAWADAFTCADMAADRAPRAIEAHHLRGAALAGAGRDREAAIAYDLALALDPEDPETLRAVADFYINGVADKSRDTTALGLELARRGAARAAARRRGAADLRAELALLQAQAANDLGRSDEAAEHAAAALALDRTLIDARHEHGVALFNLGRAAEAAAELARVLEARPDEPYAHHMLGLAREQLGELAVAEQHFARARALAPDEFPPPVAITADEMAAEIERAVLLVAAGAAHALGEVEADRGGRAPELIGERGRPRLQLHAQRLQRAEEIEDEKLGIEHVVGSVVGVRPSATDAHGP
jgi:tetratricopeptide (TPR) repeat protein